jgi:hypothetical protein
MSMRRSSRRIWLKRVTDEPKFDADSTFKATNDASRLHVDIPFRIHFTMSIDSSAILVQVKQDIANSYPDFEKRATQAWGEVLSQLDTVTNRIGADGSNYLPQVSFSDLANLKPEQVNEIYRKGSVIRDVVDDKVRHAVI